MKVGGPRCSRAFAVVPKFRPMLDLLAKSGGDLAMLVHSGERVRVHSPLASSGHLLTTATIRDFYDMRRFAQVLVDTRTEDFDRPADRRDDFDHAVSGSRGLRRGSRLPKESLQVDRTEGTRRRRSR